MCHAATGQPIPRARLQPCHWLLRVPVDRGDEAQEVHGRRLGDASLRRVLREQYEVMLPQVPAPADVELVPDYLIRHWQSSAVASEWHDT